MSRVGNLILALIATATAGMALIAVDEALTEGSLGWTIILFTVFLVAIADAGYCAAEAVRGKI